jgi:hypothetical protein
MFDLIFMEMIIGGREREIQEMPTHFKTFKKT